MQIQDKDVSNHYHRLNINASQSAPTNFGGLINDGSLDDFEGGVTPTQDQWYHVAYVARTNTDRSTFVDGANEDGNNSDHTPANLDSISIGWEGDSSPGDAFMGDLADAAVWDTDLDDADLLELASGADPRSVRSENLVFYAPMIGRDSPEMELIAGRNLTVVGAVVADNPPSRKIRRKSVLAPIVAVAGGDLAPIIITEVIMGRMYAVVFEEVAATAAQDVFEINAPADAVVILHSVTITQSTDAGDSEAEMLPILFHLGSTSGSGGSAPTASPLEVGTVAFGGTVEVNNTSQSTEGVFMHAEAFNIQAGFYYRPTPEERIIIAPSDRLIIELQAAPTDSINLNGVAIIEEFG